jgi:hypothetical protein
MGEVKKYLYDRFPIHPQAVVDRMQRVINGLTDSLLDSGDQLAAKTLELESLKNKIVERAQTPTTIKAKSAAEIRSLMERKSEREFEESVDGI